MFLDITGIIFTVLIVSPRYWFLVLSISLIELIFSIFIIIVFHFGVTEVIAGGIFSSIVWTPGKKEFLQLVGPLFLLITGLGSLNRNEILWFDLINPLASYKKPWPVMMIKTAIFRLIVFFFFFTGN